MLHSIERGKNQNYKNSWRDARGIYDSYEPDNFKEQARAIQFTEIQGRNFHQQYNGNGNWAACDVDWLMYSPACSGTFSIETFAYLNRQPADTKFTLYSAALVQLAQNDDISASNKFSSISFNFVSGNVYYIKCENKSTLVTGYYNIQIGRFSISGNSPICQPEQYTLLNLPTGAKVKWSASPSGLVSFNPVGPTTNSTTTVTRIGNGNATITATLSNLCSNNSTATVVTTKTAQIGLITPVFDITLIDGGYCQGQLYEAVANSNNGQGVNTYNWYINGVLDTYHGYKIRRRFPSNNTRIELTVSSTSCGTSNIFRQDYICPNKGFSVTPNPANHLIKIKAIDIDFIKALKIIDKIGNIKKNITFKNQVKEIELSISDLNNDMYYLSVFDGIKWVSKKLQVSK